MTVSSGGTAATVLSPSGTQVPLSYREQSAVVVTVGAGVRTYVVDGRPVLDGYDADEMADGARGQTLIPWPNRVADGKWHWDDQHLQLALTEPEQHNAIHGLLRWVDWQIAEQDPNSVRLTCMLWPQLGYPWPLRAEVDYQLDQDGLRVTQKITNSGSVPVPVAAGAHPYLTVTTPKIDDAILHIPAGCWIETGPQQIPTRTSAVDGTPYDFRSPRRVGETRIDYTFTELERDDNGRFTVTLQDPVAGHRSELWVDRAYDFVEIFTGDTLPDTKRRRQGLGVEPMTAPPNALASGDSLIVLQPEQSWSGSWGIKAS